MSEEIEWKPVYIDVQHLESICIGLYYANERNMKEKFILQAKLERAIEALKKINSVASAFVAGRNASYTDYELRQIARDALKEIE